MQGLESVHLSDLHCKLEVFVEGEVNEGNGRER